MAWSTPRTWVSGENVTAGLLNGDLRDDFLEFGQSSGYASSWAPFTASWTNITLASSTCSQTFSMRVGRTIFWRGAADLAGSTISGTFYPSLPVAAATSCIDLAHAYIYSGAGDFVGMLSVAKQGFFHPEAANSGAVNISSPASMTLGAFIEWHGFYEAAT